MLNPIQREAKDAAAEYFGQRTISVAGISIAASPGNIIGLGIGAKAVDSGVPSDMPFLKIRLELRALIRTHFPRVGTPDRSL